MGNLTTDCTDYTDLKNGRKVTFVDFRAVAWNQRDGEGVGLNRRHRNPFLESVKIFG